MSEKEITIKKSHFAVYRFLFLLLLVFVVFFIVVGAIDMYQKIEADRERYEEGTPHTAIEEDIAQYLTDNGYKMYGAWWCPYCKKQIELFGDAWERINYIECSNEEGNQQLKVCQDAGISSYPTWESPDGKRLTGVKTPETLAVWSGYY